MTLAFYQATAEEKMAQARNIVLHKAPYFTAAVYRFTFICDEDLPAAMTLSKGMVLRYKHDWALKGSPEELAADIVHECMHLLNDHFGRWEGLTALATKLSMSVEDLHYLANMAGDLAINPTLKSGGWHICEKGEYRAVFPKDYGFPDGLAMEEYFKKLLEQAQKQQLPLPSQGGGKGGIGCGQCGSIACADKTTDENPRGDARDDVLEKQYGKTEIDRAAVVTAVMEAVRSHVQQHGRGSVPGNLVEYLSVMEQPSVVPWLEELQVITRETVGAAAAGGSDFSLARPSKRSYSRDMLRPGLIDPEPCIAICIDSSGSMGHEQLKSAGREAAAVLEQLGITEVWFSEADLRVSMEWKRVGLDFFQEFKVEGRGGTDFRPAIHTARKLTPKPDILIYATDGDGAAPKHPPPDMDVIWLLVPSEWTRVPVSWGKVIIMEDDPKKKTELLNAKPRPTYYGDEEEDPYEDL